MKTRGWAALAHLKGLAAMHKNGNGSFAVRRMTVRKRMLKKLQDIKQQLRIRMHDPVPQTGAWLRSVVQGYFKYYAVPGNLDSLGLFRERVLRYWGKRFSAVVKNAGTPGFIVLSWPHNGFPHFRGLVNASAF